MYLISPKKKQFKANLHCHSVLSDGKLTPEQLKKAYQAEGYQILSITDHEYPCNHSHLSEPNFLMLTGYEGYIRPDPNFTYDKYQPEVHLNLFAKDPHNTSMVCYTPVSTKYLKGEALEKVRKVGSQRPREYTVSYINEYIRTARENGYLVGYNHPVWSMEDQERIFAYEGLFSMEMINYNSYILNSLEHNGDLYDRLLLRGKRIFVHGADDNHNKQPFDAPENDSFGGITMILADELRYDAVIDAMEKGEMYSTMGPVIKEMSFDGETVHVECSEAVAIHCYFGSKGPAHIRAHRDAPIIRADLKVDPKYKYLRVSVMDKYGRFADTRGFFRDELELLR